MLLNKIKGFSISKYKLLTIANAKIKLKIGKGDSIQVIAGDDKGKTGVVVKIDKQKHMVTISDVNMVKKTVKQKDGNTEKNFVFIEKPIHISNVKKVILKN